MLEPTTALGLLFVAGTLAALLVAARWIAGLIGSRAARRLLNRFGFPILELALAATVVLWLLAGLQGDLSLNRLAPLVVVVLAIGWAGRRVLDDFINGIVLRVEGSIEVGQNLRVGGVDGLVRAIGFRTVVLETDDGATVRVPFSRIARDALVVSETTVGQRAHSFTIEVPRDRSLGQILADVPAAALLSPWSSITRLPRVELRSETADSYLLEVTTYSLDPAFASRIEATMRHAISRNPASRGS